LIWPRITHVPDGALFDHWSLSSLIKAFLEQVLSIRWLDPTILTGHDATSHLRGDAIARLDGISSLPRNSQIGRGVPKQIQGRQRLPGETSIILSCGDMLTCEIVCFKVTPHATAGSEQTVVCPVSASACLTFLHFDHPCLGASNEVPTFSATVPVFSTPAVLRCDPERHLRWPCG